MKSNSSSNNQTDQHSLVPLIIFCGALMALSGASTDIMLPAFSTMAVSLNAPIERVQATVSVFVLLFGAGQIVYGPISDKFGRKPAIAAGMLIFIAGATTSTFATTIETMLAGRALQGFGCGAAPVIARAILRDTHSGTALARAMATSMAIFGLGPIFAPLLGFFLYQTYHWRAVFVFVGFIALALLLFDLFRYRETNLHKKPDALNFKILFSSMREILANSQSRYFIVCASIAYCALFSYVANAPIVYETAFKTSGLKFALYFALTGIGIIVGQLTNRALLPRLGILNMLKISSMILFLAVSGIAAFNMVGLLNAVTFTGLMFFFNTSFLVIISNAASLALDPHPRIAGITSAFFGLATNGVGGVFIWLTAPLVKGDVLIWSAIMMAMTGICALLIWLVNPNKIQAKEALLKNTKGTSY